MESVTLAIGKKKAVLFFSATQTLIDVDREYHYNGYTWRVFESPDDGGYRVRFTDQNGDIVKSHLLLSDGCYEFSTPEGFNFKS